jgi:hypothetical protein
VLASLIVPHVDLGTVPSWLGAGSLLLAFVIFFRDRRNSDRAQPDRLGIWFTEKYEMRMPAAGTDQSRVEEAEIEVHVRNASDLPIDVIQLAYEVRTAWMVPHEPADPVSAYAVTPSSDGVQQFLNDLRVPPGETLDMSFPVNFAHLAPDGAVQLSPIRGVTAAANWLLVIDNVGRRWVVQPRRGRARRWRRVWHPKRNEYWPQGW